MKTQAQDSPPWARLSKLIEKIPVAMLTNIDAHGALVSRPMAPLALDSGNVFWFLTDVRSTKVDHLRTLNLSFSDTDHATYVSLSGRGEIDANRARIHALWTPFAEPWFPDGPDSPNLVLLKFFPDAVEYWDAPDSKMVRLFAMAASLAAGHPIGLGEHGVLTHFAPAMPLEQPVAVAC